MESRHVTPSARALEGQHLGAQAELRPGRQHLLLRRVGHQLSWGGRSVYPTPSPNLPCEHGLKGVSAVTKKVSRGDEKLTVSERPAELPQPDSTADPRPPTRLESTANSAADPTGGGATFMVRRGHWTIWIHGGSSSFTQ